MKFFLLNFFILIMLSSLMQNLNAQSTGKVEYKYLGISFTIPEGWVGQEVKGGYLIGHNSEPGFAFLSTAQANSLNEIRMQAQQGIVEAGGTNLQLQGQLESISANSLGGDFTGTLENTSVKAFLIGVINTQGSSVLVMAAATPELYSSIHKDLAVQLAKSLVFSKAEVPPVAAQWQEKFTNAKLTYMDSYYSSGSSYGGYSTGGGYSMKREIHLCAQGYFKYTGSSSTSIDTGGAFGSSSGSTAGDGNWEIVGNQNGEAVLRLNYHNGDVYEYTLAYQDNKTLLNGERYYVTYASSGEDYAPDCF